MAKHVVARKSEVPDGGRLLVEVNGRSVGIFNIGGSFYALLNRCPHRGAELCRGSLVRQFEGDGPGDLRWSDRVMLQCPWHGWEYDLVTGRSYTKSAVRPYPVEVETGQALVDADLPRPDPAIGSVLEGVGRSGPRLRPGPFTAETFPLTIEDDYVILEMPGRTRRPAQ